MGKGTHILYSSRSKDTSGEKVRIQLLYSRKSEKVQARTCTRSIKDKKYPSEGKLAEPHFITIIQRRLKLKVESAGVVRAVRKHTTKILYCVDVKQLHVGSIKRPEHSKNKKRENNEIQAECCRFFADSHAPFLPIQVSLSVSFLLVTLAVIDLC